VIDLISGNAEDENARDRRSRRFQAALRGCAEMQTAIEEMNTCVSDMAVTKKRLRLHERVLIKKIEPFLIFSPGLANYCGRLKRFKRFAPGVAEYFGRKKELDVCRTELLRATGALGWVETWILYQYQEMDPDERSFWSNVWGNYRGMFPEINHGNILAVQARLDSIKVLLAQHTA
jgi:hypothetical protein